MQTKKLQYPFEIEGLKITEAKIHRRPVVKDRIRATRIARETLGAEEGDAVLLAVLCEVAEWGNGNTFKRFPAEIIADKLDYMDFVALCSAMSDASFFKLKNKSSGKSLQNS